ncbi:MAG: hypothetical protein A3G32_06175 [Deltaproteobacteria bacterium RIFCSPLOWO2_12_FULL_40_28]|nr:MAG: hypothetical protein A3C45_02270 [Deltaproteobacteria bacterium RIFCSPHIGHO2_02_FULL_40_28]OGQ19041.1 MAG: hypothetical protein A3E27_05360 [Deltaproteobacteria bacterium RIFCSPHIGHO2_12_FULL_40_32]OGQ40213.1 MAG: hypothetical protein A3I69_00800 [Deltaproteobacteria bacterium RIFCSPLOWO2_02_FULL_40_36]OGQ53484.1 MAG: hypothetical protein A3G32_06175 [Deltaproteobacteria bacterium RIFCSPLOWO2_12_FULL_40_28]
MANLPTKFDPLVTLLHQVGFLDTTSNPLTWEIPGVEEFTVRLREILPAEAIADALAQAEEFRAELARLKALEQTKSHTPFTLTPIEGFNLNLALQAVEQVTAALATVNPTRGFDNNWGQFATDLMRFVQARAGQGNPQDHVPMTLAVINAQRIANQQDPRNQASRAQTERSLQNYYRILALQMDRDHEPEIPDLDFLEAEGFSAQLFPIMVEIVDEALAAIAYYTLNGQKPPPLLMGQMRGALARLRSLTLLDFTYFPEAPTEEYTKDLDRLTTQYNLLAKTVDSFTMRERNVGTGSKPAQKSTINAVIISVPWNIHQLPNGWHHIKPDKGIPPAAHAETLPARVERNYSIAGPLTFFPLLHPKFFFHPHEMAEVTRLMQTILPQGSYALNIVPLNDRYLYLLQSTSTAPTTRQRPDFFLDLDEELDGLHFWFAEVDHHYNIYFPPIEDFQTFFDEVIYPLITRTNTAGETNLLWGKRSIRFTFYDAQYGYKTVEYFRENKTRPFEPVVSDYIALTSVLNSLNQTARALDVRSSNLSRPWQPVLAKGMSATGLRLATTEEARYIPLDPATTGQLETFAALVNQDGLQLGLDLLTRGVQPGPEEALVLGRMRIRALETKDMPPAQNPTDDLKVQWSGVLGDLTFILHNTATRYQTQPRPLRAARDMQDRVRGLETKPTNWQTQLQAKPLQTLITAFEKLGEEIAPLVSTLRNLSDSQIRELLDLFIGIDFSYQDREMDLMDAALVEDCLEQIFTDYERCTPAFEEQERDTMAARASDTQALRAREILRARL